MFGPLITVLAVAVLAMLSAGSLAYALLYRRIEADTQGQRRID